MLKENLYSRKQMSNTSLTSETCLNVIYNALQGKVKAIPIYESARGPKGLTVFHILCPTHFIFKFLISFTCTVSS